MTEAIDTTTSAGRLLFGILASLAAFERDVIRERTIAGSPRLGPEATSAAARRS